MGSFKLMGTIFVFLGKAQKKLTKKLNTVQCEFLHVWKLEQTIYTLLWNTARTILFDSFLLICFLNLWKFSRVWFLFDERWLLIWQWGKDIVDPLNSFYLFEHEIRWMVFHLSCYSFSVLDHNHSSSKDKEIKSTSEAKSSRWFWLKHSFGEKGQFLVNSRNCKLQN